MSTMALQPGGPLGARPAQGAIHSMLEQCRQLPLLLLLPLLKPTRPDFPKNLTSHVLHLEGGMRRMITPH
jgi:hypothetical protein